jgi:hypothetical protein
MEGFTEAAAINEFSVGEAEVDKACPASRCD